ICAAYCKDGQASLERLLANLGSSGRGCRSRRLMNAALLSSVMDDSEFLEELGKDKHEVPPIGGELSFGFIVRPVSLQGKQVARSEFQNTIQQELQHFQYLLSGDVSLEITVQVHQSDRYESDASPDLDNFLKPLLDSLTGPKGILIDDCQI